jgi:hypothetical protein
VTTIDATRLAAIHYQVGFRIDDFLARLGELLRADDIVVGGSIQVNASDAANACSAMTLVDLSSGTAIEISQQLGSLAQGCRLDTSRLAEFGALLERPSSAGIDLLILNKFGRAEAEGRGLRRNIEQAIESGTTVLTAVRPPYDEAWHRFHGGLAAELAPDLESVREWCHAAVKQRQTHQPIGAPTESA